MVQNTFFAPKANNQSQRQSYPFKGQKYVQSYDS